MPDTTTTARAAAAPLRSGQDWADWLRRALLAREPGTPGHPDGGSAASALTALVHLARRHGFAVESGNCGDSEGIASWPARRIRISADLTPGQGVLALAHQLGHVLLHSHSSRLDPADAISCQGLRKVEADSVAYLTGAHLGIDTTAIVFPYVSGWAGTDERAHPAATIQAATSRIVTAARTVTAHLDAELPGARQSRGTVASAAPEPPRHGPPATAAPASDNDIATVNRAAQEFFQTKMPGSWVPGYLAARGLGTGIQQLWQAGHAPASWHALTRHLQARGFPDQLLEAAGLARRSRRGTLIDTFRNRAILPIRAADGAVIAFIGRASDPPGPGVPKYLNSPRTSLYDKSKILFGLWEARAALSTGARPVIVEGPFDAIAVTTAGHGRFAGVAPCGTALTASHADALSRSADLRETGVLVAFDPDPAGRSAGVRAYHLLSRMTDGTSAVVLPPGQDPAQILADHGADALATTLAAPTRPLADLVTDAELERWTRWLDHAEGQLNALRAIAPIIAAMPPAHVARQVARLADRLSFDHPTVTDAVTSALPDVIARSARLGPSGNRPPRNRPRGQASNTAQTDIGANHPGASMPSGLSADSSEQAAATRDPPGRPASENRGTGHDFPTSAAGVIKQANGWTPPPRRPPRTQASARAWTPNRLAAPECQVTHDWIGPAITTGRSSP